MDHYTWSNFSPRLGLNWKLTADGKTVLKVHAGRYHPQITTGEFANVIGPSIKPSYLGYDYNFATGTFEDLSLFSSNENLSVDPDYRSPRTDQFLVGFERELFRTVGLQLSYVRKWGRDFPGWDETAGTYEQIAVVDDTGQDPTGATIDVFRLTSDPGERKFRITNTDKVFTNVHAVSATPHQADDPLVRERQRHLAARGRSRGGQRVREHHPAVEQLSLSTRSAATRTTMSTPPAA